MARGMAQRAMSARIVRVALRLALIVISVSQLQANDITSLADRNIF